MAKKILVVSRDALLLLSRAMLVQRAGYEVRTATTDDDAMRKVDSEEFDVVLLSRQHMNGAPELAQRLRARYPDLKTLEISIDRETFSVYPTRTIDSQPISVLAALAEMLD